MNAIRRFLEREGLYGTVYLTSLILGLAGITVGLWYWRLRIAFAGAALLGIALGLGVHRLLTDIFESQERIRHE